MVGAAIAGVAGAAGSIIGGSMSSSGSKSSAAAQEQIAQAESQILNPYVNLGVVAGQQLGNFDTEAAFDPNHQYYPQYNWNPTEEGLQQTPGYQFTLDQGLKSTQNAAAARGLGVSGAALKGASTYATGLADQTYNQQLQNYISGYQQQVGSYQNMFNDYWANQNNRYNQLAGLTSMGANAGALQSNNLTQVGSNIGNALQTSGQASAAGTVGATNSLTNALMSSNLGSNSNSWLNSLFSGGGSTVNLGDVTSGGAYSGGMQGSLAAQNLTGSSL